MNDDNSRQYYDDEIDLRQLFKSLKERSRFIFTFTGVVTLLAIGYVLSLTAPPTQYKVEATFLKPSESSVIRLNQYSLLNETANTAESVFSKFLTTLNSPVLQRDLFDDDGYLKRLQKEGESIVDVDKYITEFTKSLSITKNKETAGVVLPHILSTESSNPDVVSEFLDATLTKADKETINYFINTQKLKITNRLKEITTERQLLLTKSKQDRQSQIKRIKEADNQKLQDIYNKIDAARLIAKTERMNEIVTLKDAAALAASLGIIESNLNQLNKGTNNTNLNIAIQSGINLPDWYLFGETALLKMIDSLESRASDDPYIPELAILDNQLKEINNNTLLQTLEQRLDDSPFITEISQLDIETIQLKSIRLESTGINAMQLYQAATSKILPTKKRLIVMLAFIGSFMLSILLVFLMNAFKEEDVTSIQKGK